MALKDYYELSAMLRIQLPILLSFAIDEMPYGNLGANFPGIARLSPCHGSADPVPTAGDAAHLVDHTATGAVILGGSRRRRSNVGAFAGVCEEYAAPRVQPYIFYYLSRRLARAHDAQRRLHTRACACHAQDRRRSGVCGVSMLLLLWLAADGWHTKRHPDCALEFTLH